MKKHLLFLTMLFVWHIEANSQTSTSASNSPIMTFETDTINFGTVKEGAIVERDFKFTNTGKTALVITSTTGNCNCTVPSFPKDPIAPGKSGVIHVRFDSNGQSGYSNKKAVIHSNNKSGDLVLYLTGTVTAAPAKTGAPAKTH